MEHNLLNMSGQGQVKRKLPLVYLDLNLDGEKAGRVIIELRSDIVPRTAENFRALCTGEKGIGIQGKPLHYKGSKFHKAVIQFTVQGGDIVNGDGTGSESIYGRYFEDENFILPHVTGSLSMANAGRPHTNGSQFCITTSDCEHLDGSNVVFGRVVSGLGIVMEMQTYVTRADCRPSVACVIEDCGELDRVPPRGVPCADGTADRLPEHPADYTCEVTLPEMLKSIAVVKQVGNQLFGARRTPAAARKYRKCLRYLQHAAGDQGIDNPTIRKCILHCHLNLAACYLRMRDHGMCIQHCTEVLLIEPENDKALYRRGQALFATSNYEAALVDLTRARRVVPTSAAVLRLQREVRQKAKEYHLQQRQRLAKFFRQQHQICTN